MSQYSNLCGSLKDNLLKHEDYGVVIDIFTDIVEYLDYDYETLIEFLEYSLGIHPFIDRTLKEKITSYRKMIAYLKSDE